MPIILKDSNEYNAKELFESREAYKNNSYTFIEEKNQTILYEHIFENQFYGKIDSEGNSIFPSEKFLKGIKNSYGSFVLAQDFVTEAFVDMAEYYKSAFRRKKIKLTDTPYAQLKPVTAFSSLHKSYANYLNKFNIVLTEYLKEIKLDRSILKFDDFIKYFLNFLKTQKGLIIFTRTKFIKSRLTSPMISGLSISLDDASHENDLAKFNTFSLDANFPFFLESCRRFSFLVDKNAPWMLHFDFNNPYSQEYLKKFNLKNKDDVFEKRFYKAYFTDIKILKTFLHHAYTSFIVRDNVINMVEDISNCNEPIVLLKTREEISLTNVNAKYEDMFWLKLYLNIRLIEENIILNEAKLNKILLDTESILRYGVRQNDNFKYESALSYVNTIINANTKVENSADLIKY